MIIYEVLSEKEVERQIKLLKKNYKKNIKPTMMRRSGQKKRKKILVESYYYDPLVQIMIERARELQTFRSVDIPDAEYSGISIDDPRIKCTYAIIHCMIDGVDNCLMVLDTIKQIPGRNPRWTFPGGRLNDGETVQQAIVREIPEEVTGLSIRDFSTFSLEGIVELDTSWNEEEAYAAIFRATLSPEKMVKIKKGGGREQQKVEFFPAWFIEKVLVPKRAMTQNHINFWKYHIKKIKKSVQ